MDIAMLGVGHLGEAVLAGLLDSGLPISQIWATALPEQRAAALADRYGVEVSTDNRSAVTEADLVLLSVPPVAVAPLLKAIGPDLEPDATVVSLAAGVPLSTLASSVPKGVHVARAMTNIAARARQAATALCAPEGTDLTELEDLFDRVGVTVTVDESLMDLVTAVAGSGPAFLFSLADALTTAAVDGGMEPEAARVLVDQMLLGACLHLQSSDEAPAAILERIATPGGTTRAALDVLRAGHASGTVKAAVQAATARGHALSGDDRPEPDTPAGPDHHERSAVSPDSPGSAGSAGSAGSESSGGSAGAKGSAGSLGAADSGGSEPGDIDSDHF
ncbi:pyrroline-5-carboxylate reductase [Glycomyces paridis]|nr:pyrroline-5-carboxylate reductase [Glycomyces paridis]